MKIADTVMINKGRRTRFVLPIVRIDGALFEAGQLVILKRQQEIVVKATATARFMLFGGEPMEGPRYIW